MLATAKVGVSEGFRDLGSALAGSGDLKGQLGDQVQNEGLFPQNSLEHKAVLMQDKIAHRPLPLILEMTRVPAPASGPHAMEGGAHHSWRWQSPRELLHITEEAVLSWLQTQQLPGHPGSRHPTRKILHVLQMPVDQSFCFPWHCFFSNIRWCRRKRLQPTQQLRPVGVWEQGITFLHFQTHKTRDCNGVYSFHCWEHRRNYSLGPRPGALTIQEPLASGQGQSYQLGLLIKTCFLFWRWPIFPTLAPSMEEDLRPGHMPPSSSPALLHRGAEAWTAPTYFTRPHPLLEAGLDPPWVWFAASKTLPQLREQVPYPSHCPLEPSTGRASHP